MEKITEFKDCTGCCACLNACVKNAISFVKDSEGFLRPHINQDLCINCNQCKKICPQNAVFPQRDIHEGFSALSKNEEIRLSSSSGGIFYSLAHFILQTKGVVFGTCLSDDTKEAYCTYIEYDNQLSSLMTSKYVQSYMNDSFSKVKTFLKDKKNVLFCATPCQIAGLKSYLGKEYSNLYTIDFICHGVPSPDVWKQYVEYYEKKYKSQAVKACFRCKDTGWKEYSLFIKFDNSMVFKNKVTHDLYLKAFIGNLDLRPSCYNCKYKNRNNVSDLTLADYWGEKEINDDKGVSMIIVNSPKGIELIDSIKESVILKELDLDEALLHNPSYTKSSSFNPEKRRKFFDYSQKRGYYKGLKKYTRGSLIIKLKVLVYIILKKIHMVEK